MLKRIQEMKEKQDGFTLIELMVVVLIIAILIAIAIPTFLGLRERAQNRAATSDLRNALTAAKAYYTDGDTFDGFVEDAAGTDNDGEGIEPSLTWVNAANPAVGTVDVRVADDSDILLVTRSASQDYRCLGEDNGTVVRGDDNAADLASCTGTF